jgi:cell division protein FtsQ
VSRSRTPGWWPPLSGLRAGRPQGVAAAALPDPRFVLRRVAALRAPSPRMRRRMLALAVAALALAALYLLWFRDSGLVGVDRVSISGLTTEEAPELRATLTGAARDMTTLHVREDQLRKAVAAYPIVERLEVSPDFPSTLRIHVVERRPAAVVVAGGERALVSADGTVLEGVPDPGPLPVVRTGARPGDGGALRLLRVAGAAPAPLLRRLRDVRTVGGRGIVVRTRGGPDLVFGDATLLRAKWTAAARVLADPEARGATYVDVRLPERVAVGGLPAETPAPGAPAGSDQPAPGAAPGGATTPSAPAQDGAATPAQPAPGGAAVPAEPVPGGAAAPTQPGPGAPQGGATPPAQPAPAAPQSGGVAP